MERESLNGNMSTDPNGYDAIVVGSGPAGATVACELSRRGGKVLILERGGDAPAQEGVFRTASVMRGVRVGNDLEVTRAFAIGGTTSVYFAVAAAPPLQPFLSLGVDLSAPLQDASQELPLAELPDAAMGAQALRLRDAAKGLGYLWEKRSMLVDMDKCASGYDASAKWTAGNYVREAVANGAEVVTRATATRVLIRKRRALGIEYKVSQGRNGFELRQAFAAKTILSAGAGATPMLLRASGAENVGAAGFYCHPTFAVFGTVPGLKAGDNFAGSMGLELEEGLSLGDANFSRPFYRMFMLANRRWFRCLRHSSSVGIGVMLMEGLGGSLREDGYHKRLKPADIQRLKTGEAKALELMSELGGRHVFRTGLSAGHLGGMIRIGLDVDTDFQTEFRDLHICDGSIIPHSVKVPPTLTLVCLGKYLAGRLSLSG